MGEGICFAGPRDHLADFSREWWDSLIAEEERVMCMLSDGHSGAHEWTPTAQVGVSWVEEATPQ